MTHEHNEYIIKWSVPAVTEKLNSPWNIKGLWWKIIVIFCIYMFFRVFINFVFFFGGELRIQSDPIPEIVEAIMFFIFMLFVLGYLFRSRFNYAAIADDALLIIGTSKVERLKWSEIKRCYIGKLPKSQGFDTLKIKYKRAVLYVCFDKDSPTDQVKNLLSEKLADKIVLSADYW